jgi:formylglycine-generating enzyme required for sulfatase activity
MIMVRHDCPCDDNPLCPSQEGERTCSLCGFDFKTQYLSREDLAAARAQAAQRGFRAALAQSQNEAEQLRSRLADVENCAVATSPPAEASVSHCDFKDFDVFRDFPEGPEMVVLPTGQFMMGSPENDCNGHENEHPHHSVRIGYRFAVGKYPVTWDQFAQFARAMGYQTEAEREEGTVVWRQDRWTLEPRANWKDYGCPVSGRHPVGCVSWNDAQEYLKWLRKKTGKSYRLLSEAEWEYAARAGTSTPYYSGQTVTTEDTDLDRCLDRHHITEVDQFAANPWGLHMRGNVWEFVQDGYMASYVGAPADGSAWEADEAWSLVMRGGLRNASAAKRLEHNPSAGWPVSNHTFRLARDIV